MPITDRDKRTLIIGGSIVGFFVVVLLIYKLFLSGGSDASLGIPTGAAIVHTTAAPTPTASASTGGTGVVTFAGHDPFCMPQSYVSRLVAVGGAPPQDVYLCPGVVIPSSAQSPGSSSSSTGTGTPTASSTVPTAPTASSAIIGGRSVVLLHAPTSPPGSRAQVEVNGKVYNVAVGNTFGGGSFRFQSVVGTCASFLYGDQSFSLCKA